MFNSYTLQMLASHFSRVHGILSQLGSTGKDILWRALAELPTPEFMLQSEAYGQKWVCSNAQCTHYRGLNWIAMHVQTTKQGYCIWAVHNLSLPPSLSPSLPPSLPPSLYRLAPIYHMYLPIYRLMSTVAVRPERRTHFIAVFVANVLGYNPLRLLFACTWSQ